MATASEHETATARDSREAIVLAAARAIASSGVRGMRIEAVAADADVSPALLYYHFESRAGLVRAALEYASEQAPSTALRDVAPGTSGYDALEEALLGELDDGDEVRDAAIVWGEVSASAVFDPELRSAVRQVTDQWRAEVAEAIRTGLEDGSIEPGADPNDTADVLISLTDGLITRWLSGALPCEDARRVLSDALRRSLRRES